MDTAIIRWACFMRWTEKIFLSYMLFTARVGQQKWIFQYNSSIGVNYNWVWVMRARFNFILVLTWKVNGYTVFIICSWDWTKLAKAYKSGNHPSICIKNQLIFSAICSHVYFHHGPARFSPIIIFRSSCFLCIPSIGPASTCKSHLLFRRNPVAFIED